MWTSSTLPFHAVFHHLSRWMCCTRDPEEKGGKKCWASAASACCQISLPLGVSLGFLNLVLCFVSSYVWPASSSSQHKVGQSRSIRVLYTLWVGLSLLGHERVLGEETHRRYVSQTVRDREKESLYVCVLCVLYYHIHRWRAVRADKDQTMTNSFGVPLAYHDSLNRMTH